MSNEQLTPEQMVGQFRSSISRAMLVGLFVGIGSVMLIYSSFAIKGLFGTFLGLILFFSITYYVYRESIKCREEVYNGTMSYRNALFFLIWVNFFALLIVWVGTYLMMNFLLSYAPFVDNMSTALEQTIALFPELGDRGEELIDMIFALTPFDWATQMVSSFFFCTFIMSLIMAIFVRKK